MATHLADTSALARLHHDDVAARIGPMLVGGRIATCGIVDLEVLYSVRDAGEHAEILAERRMFPRVASGDSALDRAIDVQQLLVGSGHHGVPNADLIIAAAAELGGLIVLHYDRDFDLIADVTDQPTEWVVPRGTVP